MNVQRSGGRGWAHAKIKDVDLAKKRYTVVLDGEGEKYIPFDKARRHLQLTGTIANISTTFNN